jgi:hypothetical protein
LVRVYFGTKVVNTELHKALPGLATEIDLLCVKALLVLLILEGADGRNSIMIFAFNKQSLTFTTS